VVSCLFGDGDSGLQNLQPRLKSGRRLQFHSQIRVACDSMHRALTVALTISRLMRPYATPVVVRNSIHGRPCEKAVAEPAASLQLGPLPVSRIARELSLWRRAEDS